MKHLILSLSAAAALLAGCATAYYDSEGNPVSKEQMAHLRTAAVKAHLGERRYRVFVDRMYPMRGPSVYMAEDWCIEVSGDSVGLSLPYIGRAYQIPYGSGGGMHLLEPLTDYKEELIRDGRRGGGTTPDENESFKIGFFVLVNYGAARNVNPSGRESIRFTGEMQLDDSFTRKK